MLLAATSVAFGSTNKVTLDNHWNGDTVDLTHTYTEDSEQSITVAVSLNWAEVCKLDDDAYFFQINDTDITSSAIEGMGIDIASGGKAYVGSWLVSKNMPEGGYFSNALDLELSSDWKIAKYATLVFTSQKTGDDYNMHAYFYLWDANGTPLPTTGDPEGTASRGIPSFGNIGSITINSALVSGIEVYTDIFEQSEAISVSQQFVNKAMGGGTIPEPTTATLSLLALAGLAARRRRR